MPNYFYLLDYKIQNFSYSGLERLVEPLKYTCTLKVKTNSVKQEYEKQDELKRSALRAVSALLTIPDAGKYFMYNTILSTPGTTYDQFTNIAELRQPLCTTWGKSPEKLGGLFVVNRALAYLDSDRILLPFFFLYHS